MVEIFKSTKNYVIPLKSQKKERVIIVHNQKSDHNNKNMNHIY